jgi:hypothetical protein
MHRNRNEFTSATPCAVATALLSGKRALRSLWSLALTTIIISLPAQAQSNSDKDITLATSSGTAVRVPSTGALANDAAQNVALDVVYVDRQLKSSKSGKRAGKEDVAAATQKMALDARNDAVDSLDLAYRVAEKTSGVLDSGQIDSAKQNVQIAKLILKTTPPARLYVRTAISSTVSGAALHYWDAADFKKKVGSWSSYTPGEPLHIGRYLFRVDGVNDNEPYEELVLILSDPTERVISPLR